MQEVAYALHYGKPLVVVMLEPGAQAMLWPKPPVEGEGMGKGTEGKGQEPDSEQPLACGPKPVWESLRVQYENSTFVSSPTSTIRFSEQVYMGRRVCST